MSNQRVIVAVAVGFAVGALIGFFWAQGVKSRLSESVRTRYNDGVVSVDLDVVRALIGR